MTEKKVNKELLALIRLLDEPDEKIFDTVGKKIIEYGTEAVPVLEDAWGYMTGKIELKRAEELIEQIRLENAFHQLEKWANGASDNLLEAFALISVFHQPDAPADALIEPVQKIYRDLWLEMNDELTALEKIRVVNHIFFDVYRFEGRQNEVADIHTYMLDNLLRTQRGNPFSLALLYLIVTQKLGLPVFGVNLPHHFILAYMDDTQLIKPVNNYIENEVLFYVNPFNRGTVFRKSEIELFIKQLNIKMQDSFFLPCDNLTVVRRFLNEIMIIYQKNHKPTKAEAVKYLLRAVSV